MEDNLKDGNEKDIEKDKKLDKESTENINENENGVLVNITVIPKHILQLICVHIKHVQLQNDLLSQREMTDTL